MSKDFIKVNGIVYRKVQDSRKVEDDSAKSLFKLKNECPIAYTIIKRWEDNKGLTKELDPIIDNLIDIRDDIHEAYNKITNKDLKNEANRLYKLVDNILDSYAKIYGDYDRALTAYAKRLDINNDNKKQKIKEFYNGYKSILNKGLSSFKQLENKRKILLNDINKLYYNF